MCWLKNNTVTNTAFDIEYCDCCDELFPNDSSQHLNGEAIIEERNKARNQGNCKIIKKKKEKTETLLCGTF